ncbi:MAG: transketolase [Candidatus Margulisiibacteriota bacterium]
MSDDQHLLSVANTIRGLAIDAIEAANSGHPGLPLGCAELGAYLFSEGLRFNPKDPHWVARDRFILSAGHGSMLLYAGLHLAGYDLSLDDLKAFRQWGSKTPGHPEFRHTPGVETTTGPLGQGIANAVGLALAHKMLQADLGLSGADKDLLNPNIVALAGDGCLMEGVGAEASSFAGHMKLDNLIVIYDANQICLDGPISECFDENVALRYQAYGWHVVTIDGHNLAEIRTTFQAAKAHKGQPVLIIAKTIIGKGSATYQGTSEVHGKALGAEEAAKTKAALGLGSEPFSVSAAVRSFFETKTQEKIADYDAWKTQFSALGTEVHSKLEALQNHSITPDFEATLAALPIKPGATRQASGAVIAAVNTHLPFVVGGSADLSCSDNTFIKGSGVVSPANYAGRNIKYGVREFAMGAIASGLALSGYYTPFCGTFLTFSDYMKNAVRLAALMKLPVIYQFTHDSVFLGEDGPTHQPVEHLAGLRAMPGLTVIRPADSTEVKGAWLSALNATAPTALILSRQALPELPGASIDGVRKGGYVIRKESESSKETLDVCLLATGSEVSLACAVAEALEAAGQSVRVVSLPSFELFDAQPEAYRKSVLGSARLTCSIEAQSTFGWHKYVGSEGLTFGIDHFGDSAPMKALVEHYHFSASAISESILKRLS